MAYRIAFPPTDVAPSSPTPVTAVTGLEEASSVQVPQSQDPTSAESQPSLSQFLEMTLDEFETQDHALQVRVPWLSECLWFVPSSAVAKSLNREGISLGQIWTARELRNLLEVGGVTLEQVQNLTRIKQEFGAEFTCFRRTQKTHDYPYATDPTPGGPVSPWPSEIAGRGKLIVGPFTPCSICGDGAWSSYGGVYFCRRHAIAEAARKEAGNESR